MKKILSICFTLFTLSAAIAQCPNTGSNWGSLTAPTTIGSTASTWIWDGYIAVQVESGSTYEFEFTEDHAHSDSVSMTLFQGSDTSVLAWNVNIMPSVSITYTPNFSGELRAHIGSETCGDAGEMELNVTLVNGITCVDTTEAPISIYQSGFITDTIEGATYRWMNCADSSILEGDTTNILVLENTESGSYAVEVTQEGGCVDTSACMPIEFFSLTENVDTASARAYPQHDLDDLTISFVSEVAHAEYQLMNQYGVVLFEGEDFNVSGIAIDVTGYEPGTYYLDVVVGESVHRVNITL